MDYESEDDEDDDGDDESGIEVVHMDYIEVVIGLQLAVVGVGVVVGNTDQLLVQKLGSHFVENKLQLVAVVVAVAVEEVEEVVEEGERL